MTTFLSVVLLLAAQSGCCRQSFSYPVMADIAVIEVVSHEGARLKEVNDRSRVNAVVRFIDERRDRWCAPLLGVPAAPATLNLSTSQERRGQFGLGRGFLVVELSGRNYQLTLSPDEQRELYGLLGVDEGQLFDG